MNIREIAKLANVSPTTVSKVFNKKDASISPETREHVLKIIKECNYTPYENVRLSQRPGTTLMVGVLMDDPLRHPHLTASMLDAVSCAGYNAVICAADTAEEEAKKLSVLVSHQVDGLLWIRGGEAQHADLPEELNCVTLEDDCDGADEWHLGVGYAVLAARATEELLRRKHRKILCLVPDGSGRSRHFREGFAQRMIEEGLADESRSSAVIHDEDLSLQLCQYTAVVCLGAAIAGEVRRVAGNLNILVPRELSILCVEPDETKENALRDISSIQIRHADLARYAVRRLVGILEDSRTEGDDDDFVTPLERTDTVDESPESTRHHIVVVGALNMDTYYSLASQIHPGEQISATHCVRLPGGKGVNQAIGTAQLGISTHLISCCGKDYEGGIAYEFLKKHNIGVEGISFSTALKTGSCQILSTGNGETIIVSYRGASDLLCPDHILRHESLFKNASYCLVQDLADGLVEQTVRTAHEHGCKVLLRGGRSLETLYLDGVDIYLPNRKTLQMLLPDGRSLEEKAQVFLDRGVRHVILTLGHRGCYLKDRTHSQYFPAIDVRPLDTTGAADEFAATLCVYLSDGMELTQAIRYATVAAGLSTTRSGAATSMVDRETLELYVSQKGL